MALAVLLVLASSAVVSAAAQGGFLEQRRLETGAGEGQLCGLYGFTGMDHGRCADGLECVEVRGARVAKCQRRQLSAIATPADLGEPCGTQGSTGSDLGQCADGLECVPPTSGMVGAPNTCQQLTTQSAAELTRTFAGQDAPCGYDGSTRITFGQCADGLECVPPPFGMVGAPNTCQQLTTPSAAELTRTFAGQDEPCGYDGSTRTTFGQCADGLECVPPPFGMVGAPNTCQQPVRLL